MATAHTTPGKLRRRPNPVTPRTTSTAPKCARLRRLIKTATSNVRCAQRESWWSATSPRRFAPARHARRQPHVCAVPPTFPRGSARVRGRAHWSRQPVRTIVATEEQSAAHRSGRQTGLQLGDSVRLEGRQRRCPQRPRHPAGIQAGAGLAGVRPMQGDRSHRVGDPELVRGALARRRIRHTEQGGQRPAGIDTRPEDWPILRVDTVSFWLKPVGFFDRNPAHDVAPPRACHAHHPAEGARS